VKLDRTNAINKVFENIIPKEKQIHAKLYVKNYIADADTYREETLEKIVDQQEIIEKTSINDASVKKEQEKQRGKKTRRKKVEKIVTFPNDTKKWLYHKLPKKLNGLFSSASKKLFKACVLDKYRPLNEMWLFRIRDIQIGDIKTYSKMVPRDLKTEGRMILVKEYRDGIEDLVVDLDIANLAINKKDGKEMLKKILMMAQLESWGPWRYAYIDKIEIEEQ